MLIMAAVAPSCARNGPVTLRAPSYVRSANRFTTPIRMTNRKTVGFGGLVIQITRCNAKIRPSGGYTSSYDGGTMRDPVVSEFPPGVWEDSHLSHAEASPAGGCLAPPGVSCSPRAPKCNHSGAASAKCGDISAFACGIRFA